MRGDPLNSQRRPMARLTVLRLGPIAPFHSFHRAVVTYFQFDLVFVSMNWGRALKNLSLRLGR